MKKEARERGQEKKKGEKEREKRSEKRERKKKETAERGERRQRKGKKIIFFESGMSTPWTEATPSLGTS